VAPPTRAQPGPGGINRSPDASVGGVRSNGLIDAVFYAEVALTNGPRIDARPSDALTLAVIAGVPICVARARARRRRVRSLGGGWHLVPTPGADAPV